MTKARSYRESGYETGPDGELYEQAIVRLTAAQAEALRQKNPSLSPWVVVGLQCLAGAVVALLAWVLVGGVAAMSAAYGAIAVIIPAALFARGIMSKFSSLNAAASTFGFFLWEAVKLGASLMLVALAPRFIEDLSWLAVLAGLFVTLKMYWLALLLRPRSKTNLKA